MKRNVDLADISDGKLYRSNDMVKCDTLGCKGCDGCCRAMEETIVLDPYDIYRLQQKRGITFEMLLDGHASLKVVDGVVLPVLSMNGEWDACSFLDRNGRCSIHDARPGICRLFPLGRFYEGGSFRYFLQVKECGAVKTKTRIKKWLDTPDLPKYEEFVQQWHDFLEGLEYRLQDAGDNTRKASCLYLLQLFYRIPWNAEEDFYLQFAKKLEEAKKNI